MSAGTRFMTFQSTVVP